MRGLPDASLIRIFTTTSRDREEMAVVGAGFFVGEQQILTCAHVVTQALGLSSDQHELPKDVVTLDFPLLKPRSYLTARVLKWSPPSSSDGTGDIAVLQLHTPLPQDAEAIRFAAAEDVWDHPFRVLGFPSGQDDGVWATGRLLGRQATGWVMIEDVKETGFAVEPGFSGAPIWDIRLEGVVGMVVASNLPTSIRNTKTAFALPLDALVSFWPSLASLYREQLFLTAAAEDTDVAEQLAVKVEARDIVAWTALRLFVKQTDDDPQEPVRQAIRSAQAVIVLISSFTLSSRSVIAHLDLANLYGRRLILVGIGGETSVPSRFSSWQETVWIQAQQPLDTTVLDSIETTLIRRRSLLKLLGTTPAVPEQEPRNPYKGLEAFTITDAQNFFGRDRFVQTLVERLKGMVTSLEAASVNSRLLTIIGASGSGKSSVVMAGLFPRLQQGAIPGSKEWVYLDPVVPGKRPIEALGLAFAPWFPERSFISLLEDFSGDTSRGLHVLTTRLAKGKRVVLFVDQFEELFTLTESVEERQRFIDLLLTACTEPRGALLVVLTMRADFYDRLLRYPDLHQAITAHQQPLFPMNGNELRAAIEGPAALPDVQLTFEGNLVGDLLFEMQSQIGGLPLLQFTLQLLFERRSGHRLTSQAYEEIGGVKGSISRQAKNTYSALPTEEHRRVARALFLRLIDLGTGAEATRRRAALTEFIFTDNARTDWFREVMDAFISARLLTTNQIVDTPTIEVSHEAVIQEWEQLASWISEAREDIHEQRAISEDAAEWKRRGAPSDRLYRGSQLKEALDWLEKNWASSEEEAFLQASVAEQERQRHEAEELKRREEEQQRQLVLLQASVAEQERQRKVAEEQRRRYTRRVFLMGAGGVSLTGVIAIALYALREKLFWTPYIFRGHTAEVASVAWSPDGSKLASASYDTTVQIWQAQDGKPLFTYRGHSNRVVSVAWSPDGSKLASASDDTTVQIWQVQDGKTLLIYRGHTDHVLSANWSPDGSRLASAGLDKTVQVWQAQTGQLLLTYRGHSDWVGSVAWSPDGSKLASTGGDKDKTVQIFHMEDGRILFTYKGHTAAVTFVAWSLDGSKLASTSADTTVQVWQAKNAGLLLTHKGHTAAVYSVAWSPDGSKLASVSEDKTVQVWQAKNDQLLFVYRGHTAAVYSVAWSPDGSKLASASADTTVQVWQSKGN